MAEALFNRFRLAFIILAVPASLGIALSIEHASADTADEPAVSPALGISPTPERTLQTEPDTLEADEFPVRSIDGSGNNLDDPLIGAALTPLVRRVDPDYADNVSSLAGPDRPGPREISNAVSAQDESVPIGDEISDFLWQWGQFLDHDIDLTGGADPVESANFLVPMDDLFFTPGKVFEFNRSFSDPKSGKKKKPRQQVNEITAWIDASNVYGSDTARANALRTFLGNGRLLTSDGDDGDLLPFNSGNPPLPNAGGPDPSLFLAGDVRANEQVALTAMHTLFVREHNRLADIYAAADPTLTGDEIYEKARRMVGAEMQAITYNEFLPVLLGKNAISNYEGYDPDLNAGIANVFSTSAYRFGHSLLSSTLLRLNAKFKEIPEGHLPLRDAFFAPQRIINEGGIEPILRGLAKQVCQRGDVFVVDAVRNFLFGEPDDGFDLAALNIQRGRDHGLPSYNDTRIAYGLAPAASFADVSSDLETQDRLASIYDDVDEIDVWIGGLAEDRLPGAQVGELNYTIIKEQFELLRDGDRFWFESTLTQQEIRNLRRRHLADIIEMNTGIDNLADDVFHVKSKGGGKKKK